MPKYQCPECEAILKRENPIPEGKKIKCPKCESLFIAEPMRERAVAAAAPVKKKPKPVEKPAPADDEDEEGGTYGVIKEEEDTAAEKKNKDVNYGSLRDKYEKGKRGPAIVRVIKLSNGMLAIGLVTAISAVVGIVVGLWPFIFSETPPVGREARTQVLQLVGTVFGLVYGGAVCYAASQLHDLESYGWSFAGAILTVIVGAANSVVGLIGLVAMVVAMNSDPKPVEAAPVDANLKTVTGKAISSGTTEVVVETPDKKQTTLAIDGSTKFFKKLDKPARSVDLHDGNEVKILYLASGDRGTAQSIIIHPIDGEEDGTFVLMLLSILYLGVLAYGVFGLMVSIKTFGRLQEDVVKDGFEETLDKRDY